MAGKERPRRSRTRLLGSKRLFQTAPGMARPANRPGLAGGCAGSIRQPVAECPWVSFRFRAEGQRRWNGEWTAEYAVWQRGRSDEAGIERQARGAWNRRSRLATKTWPVIEELDVIEGEYNRQNHCSTQLYRFDAEEISSSFLHDCINCILL